MPASIARVMVDSPLPQLDRLFDYGIPAELADSAVLGARVRVPLRSAGRIADGFIVEVAQSGEYGGVLSDVESVVSAIPVLTPEVWALARKAADRAAGSATDIVRLAVPKRQVRVEKAHLANAAALSGQRSDAQRSDAQRSDSQRIEAPSIEGYGESTIERSIAANERLAVQAIPLVRKLANGSWVGGWAVLMARAAASVIAGGRSAILAVPDYRDQEQLEAALRDVLPPERIIRLDARQSNPDRYRAFLDCLTDTPLAIVGNRSVVYAPSKHLGLIVVWDDGDPLHNEPLTPYVHTRDAALLRQEQQSCSIMFLGHARSTEVERLVEIGWLRSVSPQPLVLPKVLPTVNQAGGERLAVQARIPSSAWQVARNALESGPVLVQVARPGYAPRIACADCRQTARCRRCEGPLQQRSGNTMPACAWCGSIASNWKCSNCDGSKLRPVGHGATRTAEDLGRAFPGVRIIIADGERQILSVAAEPALVIATRGAEPVAEGGYRAILLLDGEQMVARESLRVGEDCLRWWSNAVALAAGGATTVLVGVGGALASALVTWRQADYAKAELADRRRLRFPPAVRVATLTGTADAVALAVASADVDPVDVLGPVELAAAENPSGVPGAVRTILRFDYAKGVDIAAQLRAEVIKSATSRRRPPIATSTARTAPSLKVRFDDIEPFLER